MAGMQLQADVALWWSWPLMVGAAEVELGLISAGPALQGKFGFSFWVLLGFFPLFFPPPVDCTMHNLSCDRLVIIYCHLQ